MARKHYGVICGITLLLACGYYLLPGAPELPAGAGRSDRENMIQPTGVAPAVPSDTTPADPKRIEGSIAPCYIRCHLQLGSGVGLARRQVGCRGLSSTFGSYEWTNADGEALFALPGPGTYGVWYAFLEGIEVVVTGSGEYPVTLRVPAGDGAQVIVTAAEVPVENAAVWLSQVASPSIGTMVGCTESAGRLALDGPCAGSFVSVRHATMGGMHGVRVDSQDIRIVLPGRPCGVRGKVAIGDVPVSGCTVTCCDNDMRSFELRAVTMTDGSFSFDGLAAGMVDLVAEKEGVGTGACEVVATSGSYADAKIALGGGGSVEGRVIDQNGYPIAGAVISARGSKRRLPSTCRTDDQGRYRLDHLPLGRVDLYATSAAAGEAAAHKQLLDVGEGRVETWDPMLTILPPLITGSVTRLKGNRGIKDARIRAIVGGQVLAETVSDPRGEFCIYSRSDVKACDVHVLEAGRLLPSLVVVEVPTPNSGLRMQVNEAAYGQIRATLPVQSATKELSVWVRVSGGAERERMAYSDERGVYESQPLAGGRYEITVDGPRTVSDWTPIEVVNGRTTHATVGAVIGGDVEVILGPQPAAKQVAVLLRNDKLQLVDSLTEVEPRRHQSKCVKTGTYLVEVRSRGAVWRQEFVRVDGGQTTHMNLGLLPGEELRIPWKDLRLPDGPVHLEVRVAGGNQVVYSATDVLDQLRRGRPVVLAPGAYEVVAFVPEPTIIWKGNTTANR